MKKLLCIFLFLFLALPAYAWFGGGSPFPNNIIIRLDGTDLEGSGRILDLRQGISATYDSIAGVYHITGTTSDSIAAFSSLSPSAGDLMIATDGNSDSDCTTGGGSTYNLCIYDGSSWTIAGDGGGSGSSAASNSFETWNAPQGTDPVAETSTDTITFTEGEGIDITGTAGTDTIDFACELSTTTNKGCASLDSLVFKVTSGGVELNADGIKDEHIDWGTGSRQVGTADITEDTNKKFVTDAQLVVIGNTSGTNTGDNDEVDSVTNLYFCRGDASGNVDCDLANNKAGLESNLSDVSNICEADGDTYSGTHDFGGATSEMPNSTTDLTLDVDGKYGLQDTDDQFCIDWGGAGEITGEACISGLRHISISVDPGAWYDSDTEIFLFTVGDDAPEGVTFTEWKSSCDKDPDVEVAADLRYRNNWIAAAGDVNSVTIDSITTTSGTSSEDTNANINSGNAVANAKVVYIALTSDPEGTCVQWNFEAWMFSEED